VESLLNMPCPAHLSDTDRGVSDLLQELVQIGLSPREMECVRLRAENLRYEEIAVVLGLHAGTVGALLARAHGKIRKAVSAGLRKSGDLAPSALEETRYAS
jgi:DNA-binding CsgD family transcriptional regulator